MKLNFFLSSLLLFVTVLTAGANDGVLVGCPTIAMSGTQVSCYGGLTGTATVAVVPLSGSGNYSYNWSNGVVGATTISGLGVGTYTVTVKDNVSGCTVIGAYVVDQPDPVSILSGFVTDVNCFGNSTGQISITPTGGTPGTGYTYDWSNDGTGDFNDPQNLTGVPAGTYTVTVKDANMCTFSKSYTISQPIQALNASAVITNVSCFSGNNGAIDVSVWGGTAPYSYSWDSGPTSQDLNNLVAQTYTLTITDVKGCTKLSTYNVTQPTVLGGTISSTNVNCFGSSTGSASFSATGGTAPYSYSWQNTSTLFSANSATLSNVPSGTYTVTVTDSKGCTTTASTVINQPTLLTASAVVTNVLCHGNSTGAIDLTVSGGTTNYSYSWVNSLGVVIATTEDLTNRPAGTYTVTVTDAMGCTVSLTKTITQPAAPLSSSYVVTNVLCFGNSTGSIDLTIAGGTTPYTYNWSSGQTTQDVNFLPAGTYNFAVLDANLCPISGSAVITQPLAPIAVTNVITNVSCFGGTDGAIDLTVTGGTTPYTYTWESSTYELSLTTQDLVDFPADTYSYDLVDANGCTFAQSLTITEPPLLTNTISGVNILCYGGNNGSVDLTVTGGTTPYSFNWSNGATSEDLINLVAGTYSVTVTDFNNCTTTNSITLTQPDTSLYYSFETVDVKCNNGTDGEISIMVEGGTTPYSYAWSNGGTLSTITGLTAGNYSVTVTDFNGCTISGTFDIFQPDPLTLNEVITPVTCYGLSDGIIDISPVGGTTPYQFTWFNSDFALSAQTEDLNDWPADIYQVEIIDSNGCFYEMFFEIVQPEPLVITYTASVATCNGGSDADILVEITGGNPPYTTTWSTGATTEDLMDVPAGTYELVVVDTKGCTDSIETTITEPEPVTMTFEVTEITCIDQKDGTALATAAGGNGGYYYDWSHGPQTAFIDSLDNQYYYLTVTDVLGCTGVDSVFIPKSGALCVDPVTAFSPNGDNYNDTWVIDNMHLYPDLEMKIFNRWGNLIYEKKGTYEPWDGKMNGGEAPSDVYYYILNLNFPGRDILYGNITIVR